MADTPSSQSSGQETSPVIKAESPPPNLLTPTPKKKRGGLRMRIKDIKEAAPQDSTTVDPKTGESISPGTPSSSSKGGKNNLLRRATLLTTFLSRKRHASKSKKSSKSTKSSHRGQRGKERRGIKFGGEDENDEFGDDENFTTLRLKLFSEGDFPEDRTRKKLNFLSFVPAYYEFYREDDFPYREIPVVLSRKSVMPGGGPRPSLINRKRMTSFNIRRFGDNPNSKESQTDSLGQLFFSKFLSPDMFYYVNKQMKKSNSYRLTVKEKEFLIDGKKVSTTVAVSDSGKLAQCKHKGNENFSSLWRAKLAASGGGHVVTIESISFVTRPQSNTPLKMLKRREVPLLYPTSS